MQSISRHPHAYNSYELPKVFLKKGGFSIRDVAQGSHRETRGWIESFEMERRVLTARENVFAAGGIVHKRRASFRSAVLIQLERS